MKGLPSVEPLKEKLQELDSLLLNPNTFKDSAAMTKISKEHQRITNILGIDDTLVKAEAELSDLREMLKDKNIDLSFKSLAKEEAIVLEQKIETLSNELLIAMIPANPSDSRNTIMEIRAGTGGDEASLFAADLYRMYLRFAETQGWKTEILNTHPSESGGFKEITFSISGQNVYKTLKYESGGHRVQRIPATEANGRIHTSSATVAVLPEAEEVDIQIKPDELEITVCRASGPGGQGVNTTDSAVQIHHKPSGLIVTCADERSQQKNRVKALKVLRARLLQQKEEEEKKKYAEQRKQQVGTGDRSDRIRTYNFTQNRVTDHRIGLTLYDLAGVIDGRLTEIIEALQKADQAEIAAAKE